jgi:GH15 family glucan-1,4-alpha-glucosidase
MRSGLRDHSISIILKYQHPSGAYVACPRFPPYEYSWFRDGAFIAYAMDSVGEHESARLFHDWASRTVLRYGSKMTRCVERTGQGVPPLNTEHFHARFTPEGYETEGTWGNHQLDGLGTWLWAICQHAKMVGATPLPGPWRNAVDLVRDYLAALWSLPCNDCWEEQEDRIHTYTLAAIYGGLREVAAICDDHLASATAEAVRLFLLDNAVMDGRLVKSLGSSEVDASLLGVAVPFGAIDAKDPVMQRTVEWIERDLRSGPGGLHRYRKDTYYGGGEWILLTAWLGWYYAETGQVQKSEAILDWVEAQTTAQGDLPEQIPANLNEPPYYVTWLRRWGAIASPLLWSHAKYLILREALQS